MFAVIGTRKMRGVRDAFRVSLDCMEKGSGQTNARRVNDQEADGLECD